MRWFLLLLSLGPGGYAVYEGVFHRSSYSGHSSEQLDQLEQQGKLLASARATSERVEGRLVGEFIAAERQRRLRFYGAAGGAVLLVLASFLFSGEEKGAQQPLRADARFTSRGDAEPRFLSALDNPRTARKQLRRLAADVLGVEPDAVPHDVEVAFRARLEERDLARVEDMLPENQPEARAQRDALAKARAVLLTPEGSPKPA